MTNRIEWHNIEGEQLDGPLEGAESFCFTITDNVLRRADLMGRFQGGYLKLEETADLDAIRKLVSSRTPQMIQTDERTKRITIEGIEPYLYSDAPFREFNKQVYLVKFREVLPRDLVYAGARSWEAGERVDSFIQLGGYCLSLNKKAAEDAANSKRIEFNKGYSQETVAQGDCEPVFVTKTARKAIQRYGFDHKTVHVNFMKPNWEKRMQGKK
jgi:hypothetical protein